MEDIKLLLVENDNDFREVTKDSLEITGKYEVFEAENGLEGYRAYKSFTPDIIVADIDMPVMTGLDMIKKIREEDPDIPIVIASGHTDSRSIGKGYNLKIESFIKKPYLPGELHGCIESVFRRINKSEKINKEENKLYQLGSYQFDYKNHCLISENKTKNLTTREARILQLLYEGKGNVVKRKDILDQCWGTEDYFTSRSLDVFITNLRKHLEEDTSVEIVTVRGEGIKLVC